MFNEVTGYNILDYTYETDPYVNKIKKQNWVYNLLIISFFFKFNFMYIYNQKFNKKKS